ncbi:restriction endonuclease, partial [Methyloglobulus sp.]|uniref:restriction endonuclease n=1 Tax=Methyloglobulus sp. TaxID=2518622 RepID=UPI0032B7174B
LNFNLEDVFTIASLFSLQLNIKQVANKHQDIIRRKYKQLVYKDDYGNTISKDFDNEILYFHKNVINNDENIIKSISLYVRPCVFRNLYISTKKTAPNVDEEIIKANINKRTDIIIETITNFMVSDIINNLKFDEFEKNNVDQESLDHYEYEKFCETELKKAGWEANVTKKGADQGVDIVATMNKFMIVVQCKKYTNPIGNKAVQEVISGKQYYEANGGIVVSNIPYTKSALQLASISGIKLLHHEQLISLKADNFKIICSP